MALAYLGLGSNVGDRAAMLAAAVDQLRRAAGVRVLRQSQVYETEPVGVRDQPWFLNAVVEVETELNRRRCASGSSRSRRRSAERRALAGGRA